MSSIWLTIISVSFPVMLGGLGWFVRHCIVKYERAIVLAERVRSHNSRKEVESLRELVSLLRNDVAKTSRDQSAMKIFLAQWAQNLTREVSNVLKLEKKDVEQLKGSLETMISFLDVSKNADGTSIQRIGEDLFLVHKKKEGG